jgi:hypothetical protein
LLAIGYTLGCVALASFTFAHAEEAITPTEQANQTNQTDQPEAINTDPTFDENLIPSATATKQHNPEIPIVTTPVLEGKAPPQGVHVPLLDANSSTLLHPTGIRKNWCERHPGKCGQQQETKVHTL